MAPRRLAPPKSKFLSAVAAGASDAAPDFTAETSAGDIINNDMTPQLSPQATTTHRNK